MTMLQLALQTIQPTPKNPFHALMAYYESSDDSDDADDTELMIQLSGMVELGDPTFD